MSGKIMYLGECVCSRHGVVAVVQTPEGLAAIALHMDGSDRLRVCTATTGYVKAGARSTGVGFYWAAKPPLLALATCSCCHLMQRRWQHTAPVPEHS